MRALQIGGPNKYKLMTGNKNNMIIWEDMHIVHKVGSAIPEPDYTFSEIDL